jgi:transposase
LHYGENANAEVLVDISYRSVRAVGAAFLVKSILDRLGVVALLEEVFGQSKAMLVLTAAIYMTCRGNIFERVSDWCEGYTFDEAPLTSSTATRLFSSINFDERLQFFKGWVPMHSKQEYLAYDVTSFSTYATAISDAEWGYNRDKESLQQINLGCYLAQESGVPLFYVTYPGSITDSTHLEYMMEYNDTLGIDGGCFVMDLGFCKTHNINYMHAKRKNYICKADTGITAIARIIKSIRNTIVSMENLTSQGLYATSLRSRFYGETTNLHIYFDENSVDAQKKSLYRTVNEEDKKLSKLEQLTKKEAKKYSRYFDIKLEENGKFTYAKNYKKIDELALNCGFFCLMTNTALGNDDSLRIYRRKDVVEKGFDELKNHIDMKRMRTHNSDTTEGKMFCAFISLIAVSKLSSMLSEFMKKRGMSKDGLISEMEKIKIITLNDGVRLMNPITKTQRTILEACGLSADDIKSSIYAV